MPLFQLLDYYNQTHSIAHLLKARLSTTNPNLSPPPLPTSALPAPAWPIFTQWQGSHTVRGDRRGVGRGWLTAVPERMLRDDGWPSRYVMS